MTKAKAPSKGPRSQPRRGPSSSKGRFGRFLLLVILLGAAAVAVAAWQGHTRFGAPGPLAQPATVIIPKGAGLDAIARRLQEAGVIEDRWVLEIGARIHEIRPRAGEYLFPAAISPEQALTQMGEGHTVVHKLTIAEGLTVRQVLDQVRQADFLAGNVAHTPPEGSLLPSTWFLSRDDSRDEVVARMEKAMQQTLDAAWTGRAPNLPLKTREEALVLASIVERETALAAERPHVAAVFENRLKKSMRLQSDPTVIYGLSEGLGVLDHPLRHDDLSADHRWNTYIIDALPPSPIANPGKASIESVLHPSDSDDLYFVADGSGGHSFARSLDDHNANVTRWRRIERVRREK